MKLAYFGTASFAVPALHRLAPHIVVAVSQPDRASGRGLKLRPSPVKEEALRLGLPVLTPERCREPEFIAEIQALELDAIVVAAYGQIMPQALLESTLNGAINLHGSILPKYRGAAPIQRALMNGETETGVTLMQMDKGMDTGDIIQILRMEIGPDETYGDIELKLGELAGELAAEWMPAIAKGEYERFPQDDAAATYAPKIASAEGELSFARSVALEYNRYRAVTPAPGAYLMTRFGRLKIKVARLGQEAENPGEILARTPEVRLGFCGGSIELLVVQPEGKPPMRGSDWLNGVRLKVGDSLL